MSQDSKIKSYLMLPHAEKRYGEGGLRTKGFYKKNHISKPLITVITVVFNGQNLIEETILSVLTQSYNNVEYIIIDGGSTDDTVKIINKYEHAIDYWVSESDNGIYDAMNKGISLACGEIIHILNADDKYFNESVLGNVVSSFPQDREIYSGIVHFGKEDDFVELKFDGMNKDTIPHPGLFIRKKWYHLNGVFDISFRYAGDIDLFMRIKDLKQINKSDSVIVEMAPGGAGNSIDCLKEGIRIYWRYRKITRLLMAIIMEYPLRFFRSLMLKGDK